MTVVPTRPGLPYRSVRGALRLSTLDGALASIFGALTGGVFLTGFALRLGANDLVIGLLAALPLLATVAQVSGAYLVERVGRRRAVCVGGASASRSVWVFALALPLLVPAVHGHNLPGTAAAPWLLLAIAALSALLGSLGGVAWLSWMADLVPIGLRGRYFGSRNLVCGITSALATVSGGWLLDRFTSTGRPWGFAALVAVAVVAGWTSVEFLRRVPEPTVPAEPSQGPFLRLVRLPFADPNFRRFVRFSLLWNSTVQFAAPFFTVYMLERLAVTYVEVASLATLSTIAHLVTIRGWGRLADQYGNRPVMLVTGALAAPVPLLWLVVDRGNFAWLAPAIHILGGAAWAGHGLAGSNLLLRLSPRTHNAVYLSTFAALSGVGSAVGPVLAGLLGVWLRSHAIWLGPLLLDHYQLIFACSFVGRVLTLPLLQRVDEPKQASVREVIRVLRTVRGVNTLMGVDTLVQFVMVTIRGRPVWSRPARLSTLPSAAASDYTEPHSEPPGRPDYPAVAAAGEHSAPARKEGVPAHLHGYPAARSARRPEPASGPEAATCSPLPEHPAADTLPRPPRSASGAPARRRGAPLRAARREPRSEPARRPGTPGEDGHPGPTGGREPRLPRAGALSGNRGSAVDTAGAGEDRRSLPPGSSGWTERGGSRADPLQRAPANGDVPQP